MDNLASFRVFIRYPLPTSGALQGLLKTMEVRSLVSVVVSYAELGVLVS